LDRPSSGKLARPDLLKVGQKRLSPIELRQVRFIRSTYESPRADKLIRYAQRTLGTAWIHLCTKQLRRVHGFERGLEILEGDAQAQTPVEVIQADDPSQDLDEPVLLPLHPEPDREGLQRQESPRKMRVDEGVPATADADP
jgi:hypothetical protein